MTKDVVLVAEQDALGRVAAVWRYTSEQKVREADDSE